MVNVSNEGAVDKGAVSGRKTARELQLCEPASAGGSEVRQEMMQMVQFVIEEVRSNVRRTARPWRRAQ